MREQFQYDLKRDERFGSPVDGNEGKESMLNLVPLAGGRWIMSHRDREAFLVGKFLEFLLPKTISCPIRATPIRRDQQFDESQIDSTIGGYYTCRCDVAPSRVSIPAFSATSRGADVVSAITRFAGAPGFSDGEMIDEEASGDACLDDDFFGREERRCCWDASSAR